VNTRCLRYDDIWNDDPVVFRKKTEDSIEDATGDPDWSRARAPNADDCWAARPKCPKFQPPQRSSQCVKGETGAGDSGTQPVSKEKPGKQVTWEDDEPENNDPVGRPADAPWSLPIQEVDDDGSNDEQILVEKEEEVEVVEKEEEEVVELGFKQKVIEGADEKQEVGEVKTRGPINELDEMD